MRALFLVAVLVLAVKGQQALQPQAEAPPTSLQATETPETAAVKEVFTAHVQQEAIAINPDAAKCFLILATCFSIVNVVLFIAQQIKFFQGKYSPTSSEDGGQKPAQERMLDILDEKSIVNVKAALSFTPTVSLLMLFLLFRAVNHGIDLEENSDYKMSQCGMWIVTLGILIQAVDGILVNVNSAQFSVISEAVGTVFTYTGFALLLVGLVVARSHIVPMSVAEKCIIALAILLICTMIGIKLLQFKTRFMPGMASPDGLAGAATLAIETSLEQVRGVGDFVPVLITAFFYLHFYYSSLGSIPDEAEYGMTFSTVGVYIQAVAIFLKFANDKLGTILTILGVVVTYVFFAMTMYAAIDAAWPPTSMAIQWTLILLFLLAFLKLVIATIQDIAQKIITSPSAEKTEEESSDRFGSITKLFQEMMATAAYALIVCVFLLYFHFRAQFLLQEEPDAFIKGISGLSEAVYLVVICIFCQLLVQIVELGVGPSKATSMCSMVALLGVNLGIAGIVIAAISN